MATRHFSCGEKTDSHSLIRVEHIALGLYWTWVWLFYESNTLFTGFSGANADPIRYRTISLIIMAATLFAGALISKRISAKTQTVIAAATAVFAGPMGIALLAIPAFSSQFEISAFFVGVSQGALSLLWALYITSFPKQRSYQAYCIAVSVVIGSLGFFVISHFVDYALLFTAAFIPAIAGVIALATDWGRKSGGAETATPENAPRFSAKRLFYTVGRHNRQSLPEYDRFLTKTVSGLMIYGLVYGCLRYLSAMSDIGADAVALLFLATGALLTLYFRYANPNSITLAWRLIFPVTILGIILIPFAGQSWGFASIAIAQTGYLIFESLVWIVLFDTISRFRLNRMAVFGMGRGITALSMALGPMLLGSATEALSLTALANNPIGCAVFVLIAAALVAFVNLFLFNEKAAVTAGILEIDDNAQEQIDRATSSIAATTTIEDSCAKIAERYGLTCRETEILEHLAKGKYAPQISEELYLSKATVRTHTYNIYKKMNVHTRAELLVAIQSAH